MSTRSEKLASIAQWEALKSRYPLASPLELGRQAAVMVLANLVTLRLVLRGALRPWEVVALVACEALVLTAIAFVQTRFVPAAALLEKPQPLRRRLGTLAFGLAWLVFVYGVVLGAYLRELDPLLAALRDPWTALRTSALRWPLLIAAAGALFDAVGDWQHWHQRGGVFLSTPGFNALARWLTLFLGGIPFFVPFALGAGGVALVAKGIEKRVLAGRRPSQVPTWPLMAFPLLAIALFWGLGKLVNAGVLGWVIGYTSAKIASEALILFLPLIATKASAEEKAALAKAPKRS